MKFAAIPVSVVILVCFGKAACSHGLTASAPLPKLPELVLESLPRPAAIHIRRAYEAVRRSAADPEANGRLGQILHAYEQFEAAAVCYKRAHILDPRAFRWLYYLGSVQASALQHGEAVATLREALKFEPNNVAARMQLGKSLLESGELTAAADLYASLSSKHPSKPEVRYRLARAIAAQGRKQEAVEHYRAACKLMPAYGAAHYGLALVLRDLDAGTEAEEHFALSRRYQSNSPEPDDPLLREVQALRSGDALEALRRGVQLESKGELAESAREQERALQIDPSLSQAHINLVALYGRLGQPARAGEHFRKALSQRPDQTDLHYNYGIVLAGKDRIAEAETAFRRALAINPHHADASVNLGRMLERQGLTDDAIRQYQHAIENQPSHGLAHFQIGRLLVARNRHDEAIEYFRRALSQQDEQTPLFLFGLATAYAGLGNAQDALVTARKAREQAASLGQTQLVAAIDRDFPGNLR